MIEKLVVNGIEIQVNRSGEGPPLLFLHPSIGVGRSDEFLGALSLAFDVIAPSHPGFDESQVSNAITSADDLAYFYLDLIAQLDLRNVILVGASLGGWIALEMLTKTSDRIAGAVLLDSVGVKFGGPLDIDIADIFTLSQADWAARAFHDPALDRTRPADISDEELLLVARNREATARISWLPCLYNPKLRARLHRIDVPTLLLWGASDRIVLPSYGQKLAAALPGSRLEIISECGHFPHIERAAIAARSVMDFALGLIPATKAKLAAAS